MLIKIIYNIYEYICRYDREYFREHLNKKKDVNIILVNFLFNVRPYLNVCETII